MRSAGDLRPVVQSFVRAYLKQGLNRPPNRRDLENWLMTKKCLEWPDAKMVVALLVLRRVLFVNAAGEIYMTDCRERQMPMTQRKWGKK
jgi:hypothetical protein